MNIKTHTKALSASLDSTDVEKFSELAEEWWNPDGPFKPLHVINPMRLKFIRECCSDHFSLKSTARTPFNSLTILDIGCGGGLLTEPLSRLGGEVTGLDASEESIRVARSHALSLSLSSNYVQGTAEELAEKGREFDLIVNMEVIEHVADLDSFFKACRSLLDKGGLMLFSTINRTAESYLKAIVAGEYILRWLPRGTHDWRKFKKPSEVKRSLEKAGFELTSLQGFGLAMPSGRWQLNHNLNVNYFGIARPISR